MSNIVDLSLSELVSNIKNKKLYIASSSNSKVNSNVNLKWKKDLEY